MMMTAIRLMAVTGLVLALLNGCVTTPDQAASARLVGKWSNVTTVGGRQVEDATDIRSDGTFNRRGVIRDAKGSRTYSARGVWRIENAVFHETIEWSEFPGWKPGPETVRKLVAVTDWEWVMKDDLTGAELRFWRYPQ